MSSGFSVEVSAFVSNVGMDIVDKIPTAIIVFLLIKSVSDKTLVKLPNGKAFVKYNSQ